MRQAGTDELLGSKSSSISAQGPFRQGGRPLLAHAMSQADDQVEGSLQGALLSWTQSRRPHYLHMQKAICLVGVSSFRAPYPSLSLVNNDKTAPPPNPGTKLTTQGRLLRPSTQQNLPLESHCQGEHALYPREHHQLGYGAKGNSLCPSTSVC